MHTFPSMARLLEAHRLARAQGGYFLAAGLWPLLNRRSFEAVTGRKTDFWLVRTVGTLISVIGVSLLRAFGSEKVSPEAKWLAMGSALGLAGVSGWYASRGRISKIYLMDAALELGWVAAWWMEGTQPFHHEHKTEGMPPSRTRSPSVAAHVPLPNVW